MSIPQLPAATIFFDGFGQEDNASRRKTVRWRLVVRLYVSLRDAEKAQNEIKTLILRSINKLRQNPTLGESCLYHTISSGNCL